MYNSLSPNDATIRVYNEKSEEYLRNTPHHYSKKHARLLHWIDTAVAFAPPRGSVLEIGSGHGRDASYIESKGFSVVRTDGSQAFVDYLRGKGEAAFLLNAIKDPIPGTYDMIFANAVFPHFTSEDLTHVLKKLQLSLTPNGILAFCTKQGSGEVWINEKEIIGRYTRYWQPQELQSVMHNLGYEVIFFERDAPSDVPNHMWIHVIAKKQNQ